MQKLVALLSAALIFTSCQSKTIVHDESGKPATTGSHGSANPTSGKYDPDTQIATPPVSSESSEVTNAPLPPVTRPPKAPEKVGVILGPGGLRSFAHIGVLKSFHEAKIPIHGIIGLEWGALPALLFSRSGQVHDVEWKMMRMKEEDLPKKGIFSSKVSAESITKMGDFFNTVVKGESLQDSKVPFACPVLSISKRRTLWHRKGDAKEVLMQCLAYPPLFRPHGDFVASPFSIAEAAKTLRDRGAELIIYVDVLGDSALFSKQELAQYSVEFLLWREIWWLSNQSPRLSGVDHILRVRTTPSDLMNFDVRRQLIQDAQTNSRKMLTEIGNKYSF